MFDFLLAIYDGNLVTHLDPGGLGAAFYIPAVVVPPLLVAHIMWFWLLLTKDPSKGVSTEHRHVRGNSHESCRSQRL